jgi:hypothetical protein
MALSDIERKRWEQEMDAFLERKRPPPHIRAQLDLGYRIAGQSVEIFETRPDWKEPSRTMENPVAKATFVRSRDCWRIFWMRADRKWHGYGPRREVRTLGEFLQVVERDQHCCFFG